MSDENIKQKQLDVPANYYFFGNPGRVIDRVKQLVQLETTDSTEDQRLQLAIEVLSYCPVPFLDELITALDSKTEQDLIALRDKASNKEINLRNKYSLSEEERDRISTLALCLLGEKIINSDAEKILPTLRFVQQYIEVQNDLQELTNLEIAELNTKIKELLEEIEEKRSSFSQDQASLVYDFALKLSKLGA